MAKKVVKKKVEKSVVDKNKKQNKNTSSKKQVRKSSDLTNNEKKSFLKNYNSLSLFKKVLPILVILFIMWYAFFIRSGPINLNGIDEMVEQNTYSQLKSIIQQDVNSQYPNLNDVYKQEEIDKRYNAMLKSGVIDIQGQQMNIQDIVDQNVKTIKDSFKADNGQTYLTAIDPYHYYKLSENMLKNGHQGTSLKENEDGELQPYVFYKKAPNGKFISKDPTFHVWLQTKLLQFNEVKADDSPGKKISAIFLISAIFAMLSAIPCYLIIRKFSNDLFAFMGTMIFVSIGTFVSRTVAGFVDTDAYVVFFPLTILAFILYGFTAKNNVVKVILSVLSGVFMGLFLWAWGNGWFIFLFIIIAFLGYTIYVIINNIIGNYLEEKREVRTTFLNDFLVLSAFLISSFIFTFIISGRNIFTHTINKIYGQLESLASISQTNIWPNVYSSVAELSPASFNKIISSVGGGFIFFVALIGLLFLAMDFKHKSPKQLLLKRIVAILSVLWFILFINTNIFTSISANNALLFIVLLFLPIGITLLFSLFNGNISNKIFLTILLSSWVAGTIYMSLNGVRFILLLAPAFSICFGIGMYYKYKIINFFTTKEFELKGNIGQHIFGIIYVCIFFAIFIISAHSNAMQISNGTTPNFDDAWYGVMDDINANSSKSAIITSWWDFGHFFAAIADRGVTFDGGSQTTPASHWVGKLLMENDEEVSVDILRMLNCGNNNAFDYMLEITNDETSGVLINKIIYETFGKSKEEKIDILKNNKYFKFTDEQVDNIMEELYCENPPENFLITSEDMVSKAGVWAHWGSWDFTKKYVRDNYKKQTAQEISEKIDENISLVETYIEQLNNIDLRSKQENIKKNDLLNQWFAPYPTYLGNGKCDIGENMTLSCGIQVQLNNQGQLNNVYATDYPGQVGCMQTDNSNVLVCGYELDVSNGSVGGDESIKSIFTYNNILMANAQTNTVDTLHSGTGDFDFLVIPTSEDQVTAYFMQAPLGDSLFTKLFYLEGIGTNHFEEFSNVRSVTGVGIKTWKTVWEVNETNTSFDVNDFRIEEDTIINESDIVEVNNSIELNDSDVEINITN
ncbi:MAG: STT3 domain-containing protein [Nanoarchaeota archaeon]